MKHQIVTFKFPTLERQALNRVRKQFPQLKRRGFAATLRAAFDEIQREEVSFIPDGWFIDGDLLAGENDGPWAIVTCVEIEDQHPLSAEKLWLYCDLYDTLDFFCCSLRLLVFDRYGHNRRQLDLRTLYLNGLIELAQPAREAAAAAETAAEAAADLKKRQAYAQRQRNVLARRAAAAAAALSPTEAKPADTTEPAQ